MTNTQRNTTVIVTLLVIILCVGLYLLHKLKKEMDAVTQKNVHLKAEIFKYDKLISMQTKLEADFAALRLMIAEQSKVLVQKDTPAGTYNYLLRVLKWMNNNLFFDFAMSKNESSGSNWNEYVISGRGEFLKVADFIKNLEYQRALITLEDVSLTQDLTSVSDTIYFSIVFRTHYKLDGTEFEAIKKKDIPRFQSSYSVFRTRILEKTPISDYDPNLVDVENCSMFGITETRVFIRDSKGIIHILSVGDKVAYGYLYLIDKNQEKAIFRINKYGTQEEKTIYFKK